MAQETFDLIRHIYTSNNTNQKDQGWGESPNPEEEKS